MHKDFPVDLSWIKNRVKYCIYVYIYLFLYIFYDSIRYFFMSNERVARPIVFTFYVLPFRFFYCFVTVQFIYTHHENKMTKTLVYRRFLIYSARATDGRENSKVNPSPPTVPTQPMSIYVFVFLQHHLIVN